jgi:hypothetical protein
MGASAIYKPQASQQSIDKINNINEIKSTVKTKAI